LISRHAKDLTAHFPELAEAIANVQPETLVLEQAAGRGLGPNTRDCAYCLRGVLVMQMALDDAPEQDYGLCVSRPVTVPLGGAHVPGSGPLDSGSAVG
jgi:hypothetical protein